MATIESTSETTAPPPGYQRDILVLVCACQFMVILDAAIVNVALPSIERELGFSPTSLAWVVNGYLLTFAGFMLFGGRAIDLFGRRRMLVAGLCLFSLSSLMAGLAMASSMLVAARLAQGLGAALLAPATLAVINVNFADGPLRAKAFGAWSAAGGIGGMSGALVGGALTTGVSWRWVFLINVPIGVMLIALAMLVLAGDQNDTKKPLDLAGALTGTAGLGATVYGVMQSADYGWLSFEVMGPIGSGCALLIAFLLVEARFAPLPMLPLGLFTRRSIAVGNVMLVLFGGIAIAMWYFTSLLLQNVLGYSAIQAGLGQTPAAVTFVVVARLTASLLPRLGVRTLVLIGCACFVIGFGWLTQAGPASSYLFAILGPTLLVATGIGLIFPTLMAAATSEATDDETGIVAGLASTSSQVGSAIGLAVLATAASAGARSSAGMAEQAALAVGYGRVFLIAAGLALSIALASTLLQRRLGI